MPDSSKKRQSPNVTNDKNSKNAAETSEEPIIEENSDEKEQKEDVNQEEVVIVEPLKDVMKNEQILSSLIIEKYEGGYDEDGFYEGEGKAYFLGDMIYNGCFKRGKMHGNGSFYWPDGTTYTGDFIENNITGQGKYVWPDNSSYEGDIINGFKDGYGSFKCSDQKKSYVGHWKNSTRHGKGTVYYDESGEVYYDGNWVDGNKEGFGIRRFANGNMYEGEWKNNVRNGQGTMYWYNLGQEYSGEWLDGIQNGLGENIWYLKRVSTSQYPLRNQYNGNFVNGERDGYGTFYYANGSIYEGEWKRNMKHGKGKFTFKNGSMFHGQFENDSISDFPDIVLSGMNTPDITNNAIPIEYPNIERISTSATLQGVPSRSFNNFPEGANCQPQSEFIASNHNRPVSVLSNSIQTFLDVDLKEILLELNVDIEHHEKEIEGLIDIVLRYTTKIKKMYKIYSCIGVDTSIDNTYVMNHLQFYRFLKDNNVDKHGFSLIDIMKKIDIKNELNECFQQIFMRNFLTYLVKIGVVLFFEEYIEKEYPISSCFESIVRSLNDSNDLQINGYIFNDCEKAKEYSQYIDQNLEMYYYFCYRFSKSEKDYPMFKCKDILMIFKELNLITEDLSYRKLVSLITKEDKDEDGCYNMDREVSPLEFMEVLCGSALCFANNELIFKYLSTADPISTGTIPTLEVQLSTNSEKYLEENKENLCDSAQISSLKNFKATEVEVIKSDFDNSNADIEVIVSNKSTASNQSKLSGKTSRAKKSEQNKRVEKDTSLIISKSKDKKDNTDKNEKKRKSLKTDEVKIKSSNSSSKKEVNASLSIAKNASELSSIDNQASENVILSNDIIVEQVSQIAVVPQKSSSNKERPTNIVDFDNDLSRYSSVIKDIDFDRWALKMKVFFNLHLFPAFARRKEVDLYAKKKYAKP